MLEAIGMAAWVVGQALQHYAVTMDGYGTRH